MAWAQQATFRKHLKRFKAESGLTNDEVAPLLGLKPSSLQKYLYGTTRRPGQDILVKAAEVFRCPLGDLFLDQPMANIPEGLEAVDQFRFDQIVEKLSGDDLTAADRQILYEDFIASYNRLKTLKAEMMKK